MDALGYASNASNSANIITNAANKLAAIPNDANASNMLALENKTGGDGPGFGKVVRNSSGTVTDMTPAAFKKAFISMILAATENGDFKASESALPDEENLIGAFARTPLAQFKHLPAKVNLINVPVSGPAPSPAPSPAPAATSGGAKLSGSKRTSLDKITLKKAKTMRKQT